jgi:hypothetical protein
MRRLIIEEEFGVFHVGGRGSGVTASTLEKALAKASPNAPANYIHHAAEVLEPLLGAEKQGQIHTGTMSA